MNPDNAGGDGLRGSGSDYQNDGGGKDQENAGGVCEKGRAHDDFIAEDERRVNIAEKAAVRWPSAAREAAAGAGSGRRGRWPACRL